MRSEGGWKVDRKRRKSIPHRTKVLNETKFIVFNQLKGDWKEVRLASSMS